MKLRNLAIGIVVLLAASYGAATYYFSSQAAIAATGWAQKLSQAASLKIANEEYRRGFLSSTQEITFEFPAIPGGNAKAQSVTFRNVIQHGPLPGFSALGIARIEHSLVFDDAFTKELAGTFGGQPPLRATTLVDFSGAGSTELKGAAATYKSGDGSVSWQGLAGTMRFTKGMASYSAELAAPGLAVIGKDGMSGNFKALSIKTDQAKLANTDTVYLGKTSMGVEAVSIAKDSKPEFELKNLAFNLEGSSKDSEFIDVVVRVLVADVRSAAFSASNAEYAFSARHLHAQSLDQLAKAMRTANQQMQNARGGPTAEAAGAVMLSAMMTHGVALLQHEPVIAIERIGFLGKEGETKISGAARLVGVNAADAQAPFNLIAKVQADASIAIPEAVAGNMMAGSRLKAMKVQGREPGAEEAAQLAAQAKLAFDQQLAQFVEQGYITRENGILSSKLAFKGGQFTVNDKPFNPLEPPSGQPEKPDQGR